MNHRQVLALFCAMGLLVCGNRGFAGIPTSHPSDTPESDSSAAAKDRDEIRELSGTIDALVLAKLKSCGQEPNAPVSDEVFLRRIYLDIAGRIPTLEEVREFLDTKNANKRADLIDSLLDSPGYVSHHFNLWADVLRVKTRLRGGNPGQPYVDFIKESLADNMPYDQFVRELITASGPVLERGNGATGYFLRDDERRHESPRFIRSQAGRRDAGPGRVDPDECGRRIRHRVLSTPGPADG